MGIDLASTDKPFGFKPWGPVLHASMYAIATSYGTAVSPGDLIKSAATSINTSKYGNLLSVAVMTTGTAGLGIGACLATFDDHGDTCYYIPASTVGDSTVAGYARETLSARGYLLATIPLYVQRPVQ